MKHIPEAQLVDGRPERRHDLDWLKALVVLNLFFFHAAWMMVLVPGFSYINRDKPISMLLKLYVGFTDQWHMQLLFLISGASTCFALRFRSGKEYVKERVRRLLIPLVFGVLVILPPLFYYWPDPGFAGKGDYGFFTFLHRDFLRLFYNDGDLMLRLLWFIAYLFAFSLIALPLFLQLRKESGRRLTSRFANSCGRRGVILLMGVPLAIIQATFTVEWPSTGPGHHCVYNDVARFLFFMTLFIYGYLICSDDRFWQAIHRHFRVSLLLGTGCMAIMLSVWIRLGDLPTPGYTPGYMLYMALDGFNTWFWLLAFLGFGRKLLSFSNKVLEYAREASYPFYLLHETIMVVIGLYVVRLRAPVIVEFLVISMTTFLATIILYHLIIRRANITRFLFGMKLRK